ncbi:hypothetical protein BCR33DRAFT_719446 [Rhizoclosmatium globosum]|uniref:Uncharacterized protein n=1 Tax=Rhizoclosmatium globosum TaxID=329046 RepID=A0A1Y2C2C4_9FUNG|nr:hypothetical protein BCR33DRAFT_719446 [Rhizoclosmatium globosum]|eukprot:ORY40465.1 hypothetical protein BCR33DRAFT_719446 [Rhizoclosmatium globosum]
MKAVPSFKDHGEIIDQVCSFWVYECDAEGFFVLNYLLYQLEILSKSVEDRTKFWVAFEIVRHSGQSSNTLEDLIAQVENASL